jgi:hypothetical protein
MSQDVRCLYQTGKRMKTSHLQAKDEQSVAISSTGERSRYRLCIPTADAMNAVSTSVSCSSHRVKWGSADAMNAVPLAGFILVAHP